MTFIFGKLVWLVLQPGNLLLICLLVGVLILLFSRWRHGRILVVLATIGFLLVAVLPIGPAMLLLLEERFSRPAALPEKIDGIVLLGGAVNPGLSQAYGETVFGDGVGRVLTAVTLARRYPQARLVVSGGEAGFFPIGYSEARATLGFLLDEGIARSRIVLEERSHSTHENATYGKELLHPAAGETWLMVTSAYHMPRAVASFRGAGWTVIPYPTDYRIDPASGLNPHFNLAAGLDALTLAGKEWVGLVAYRLLGWTPQLFPAPQTG
jgi:uncharacterized SAM-binding protein YcdF (DUF218 family)